MVNLPTCATQQGNPGGVLPGEYRVRGQFTHITTTAKYTGLVSVCLNYSDAGIGDEYNLKLFHWDGTRWNDVTTSLDPVSNTICGQDDSLSWWFMGDPSGGGGGGTGGLASQKQAYRADQNILPANYSITAAIDC